MRICKTCGTSSVEAPWPTTRNNLVGLNCKACKNKANRLAMQNYAKTDHGKAALQLASNIRRLTPEDKAKRNAQSVASCLTKRKIDPAKRFEATVRSRIRDIFRDKNIGKTSRTYAMIGCDYKELLVKLILPLGKGPLCVPPAGYVVDHVIPLSLAVIKDDLEQLCHYSNLQLLTAKENEEKSDKIKLLSGLTLLARSLTEPEKIELLTQLGIRKA